MGTDLIPAQTSSFPAIPAVVSGLVSRDEYDAPRAIAAQIGQPTLMTDTPVVTSRLWGEDRDKYTIVAGVTPIYTPVSINASDFDIDIDIVYAGSANSGSRTTATHFPLFGITGQAVSDTFLKIGTGTLIASFAIATPITGPLETQFAGLHNNPLGGHYGIGAGSVISNLNLPSKTAERFARSLRQMIRVEPVIDGYDHPAERFLEETFKRDPDVAKKWFWSALRENLSPSLVADSLRLLGRISPAGQEWCSQIVTEGLRSGSAEVRDAAMQAIESWGNPALAGVLNEHRQREPIKWLREYADQIIQDLIG